MIHTYVGERASRTHENQMLQSFLEALEPRWLQSSDWIYVVAFAMWEGAEVDLVCILPSSVVVADFKNYSGHVSGTENGPWSADGIVVKGGAKTNPFVQLRDNRTSVRNWLSRKKLLDGRNLGHIAAGVVFSGPIVDEVDISPRSKSWFHVTDFDHCAQWLSMIASPELSIGDDEAAEIVHILGVGEFEWAPSRPSVRTISGVRATANSRPPLTEHQTEAMRTIGTFLTSGKFGSLAVRGMTSTGKTRLMVDVVGEVARQGRMGIPLAPNKRLALETNRGFELECSSVYQHIYDSTKIEELKSASAMGAIEVIPMRPCTDPEDCVYIVDDAHLLGNAEFKTPDGKRFGSGRLLTDFFDFTGLGRNKRQVVFFGDPYQIPRASPAESILDGSFQKLREVNHQDIELDQLIDSGSGEALLRNALSIVEAIRSERYASLALDEDESMHVVDKKQAASDMLDHFQATPESTWYLAETHAKVHVFTRWLRERLLDLDEPGPIEIGDWIEVYSAPHAMDADPSEFSSTVEAGQRLQIEEVGKTKSHRIELKGRQNPTKFRTTSCRLSGSGSGTVELLQDFLLAEKPELEIDTLIALKVWKRQKEHPELTCGRYGYGATVHHGQGLKRAVCFVNAEHSAGRHTEGYFRWLYTAMTIAQRSAVLFNFEPLHPFDAAAWNLKAMQTGKEVHVGAGWRFDPDAPISSADEHRPVPNGMESSRNLKTSVAIWLRIAPGLDRIGWTVQKIASHSFQEHLGLVSMDGATATLRVTYNGKNEVTALKISDDAKWLLLADIAEHCISPDVYT